MSSEPRAFATVDRGTATVAVTLVGRFDGRWRLLGATAAPAAVATDPLLELLGSRLVAADAELAASLGLHRPRAATDLSRVTCQTVAPPSIAVVAATERVVRPLAAAAATAGWVVRPVPLDGAAILEVAAALADPGLTALLAGTSDPPGADERPLIGELVNQVAAATQRRPELAVVLSGAVAEPGSPAEPLFASGRPGATLLAPAAAAGGGVPLRSLLDSLRGGESDGRRAIARAAGALARVLERRIEVLEVGASAGARVAAGWSPGEPGAVVSAASVATAGLVPAGDGDDVVDAVAAWLTAPLDRLRLRDRLYELAIAPWGHAAGDGALLRLAAARAALERLVAATPWFADEPNPDLVVAAGGAWSVAPGPAVALALADVVRRPGVTGLGFDHARLLGPLGTVADEGERLGLVADLRDDLVAPLGSVVMPAGLRAGRPGGTLIVHGTDEPTELDLVPGGLELVDLPPGERVVVELRFRHTVRLGARVRHVAVEVGGGLGGLLVDLRDVPMRLPDRPDRRRELLAAWQSALWAGIDT